MSEPLLIRQKVLSGPTSKKVVLWDSDYNVQINKRESLPQEVPLEEISHIRHSQDYSEICGLMMACSTSNLSLISQTKQQALLD